MECDGCCRPRDGLRRWDRDRWLCDACWVAMVRAERDAEQELFMWETEIDWTFDEDPVQA